MAQINNTIFAKTLLAIVGIFLLIGLSVTSFFGITLYTDLMLEYKSKGTAIAKSIANASVELMMNQNSTTIQNVIGQFQDIPGVAYIIVRNSEAKIIAHTFVPEVPPEFSNLHKDIFSNTLNDKITVQKISIPQFGNTLDISAPILAGQVGYVHVGMELSTVTSLIWSSFYKILGIILGIFVLSMFIMHRIIGKITAPLVTLKTYTKSLGQNQFVATPELKLTLENLTQHSSEEIAALSSSFSELNEALIKHIENLQKTTAAKEKIESELTIAKKIQHDMLPHALPALDTKSKFDIYAYMQSAKEVGGDFYDFFYTPDHANLIITIGDVSGKGVPAAITMAICVNLIRAAAIHSQSPSDILGAVNHQLSSNNDAATFVTVFLGVIDLKTGNMNYCLAGHPGPFVTNGGHHYTLPLTQGMAIGIDEDFVYASKSITLTPNDQLVAYTDGVNEAENIAQDLFGTQKIETRLQDTKLSEEPKVICDQILEDIQVFTIGAEQSDDITLLALKWLS